MVEFCRKYETEQEKVLPFFSPSQQPGAGDEVPDYPEEAEGADPGREAATALARAAAEEAAAAAGPSDPSKPKLCSHGVDDKGVEVEEWDYLNRYVVARRGDGIPYYALHMNHDESLIIAPHFHNLSFILIASFSLRGQYYSGAP